MLKIDAANTLGETAYTADELMLYQIELADKRVASALGALSEIAADAGSYPPELVAAYNTMRDQYVSMAIPLAEAFAEAHTKQGQNVQGQLSLPPRIVVKSGLGDATGVETVEFQVPELDKLPPGLAKLKKQPKNKSALGAIPQLLMLVFVGLAFLVGVILVTLAINAFRKNASDSAAIAGTVQTRARAFDFAKASYTSCAATATTTTDKQACLTAATAAAKTIADSGVIPYAPREYGWLYYLGLFVVVAGVGTAGWYLYKRKQARKLNLAPVPTGW